MLKNLHFFFSLFSLCCILHCTTTDKKTHPALSPQHIAQSEKALSFIKNQEFLKGAIIYDKLARSVKDPTSKALMLFNAGVAYKEAGQCEKSLKYHQKFLRQRGSPAQLEVRGLMEQSYAYECLGDIKQAFLSLKSAQKKLDDGPWLLRNAIYPARQAIAQAGLGKIPQAERYKTLALDKILQSRSAFSTEEELNHEIRRTFYLMGRSYAKKDQFPPSAFLRAFPYHQLFLLQALFIPVENKDELAIKELYLLFDKLFFAISRVKNKAKYKGPLTEALLSANAWIQRENLKKLEIFYSQKSKKAIKLLSTQ